MPAEWEPHTATWLVWPQNSTDWPGKYAPIPWVYADIVRHLTAHEIVHLVVDNADVEARARRVLSRTGVETPSPFPGEGRGEVVGNVRFHQWPTNRGWTRDSGPIFVKNGDKVDVTNWGFNAWAKYDDWPLDNELSGHVAKELGMHQWCPEIDGRRLILEGGSIDVNGAGLMLTTEECLLSPVQQRNPGVDLGQLETVFRDYLGVQKVIWLDRGIVGDDTHGHVDDITRFVSTDTVVTAVEPDTADPNHEILAENLRRLKAATDVDGRPLNIVELPMPSPVIFSGQRVPASYANFYIANNVVLVPTFNDPRDRVALGILADLFPTRSVVGIHSRDLIWGLGALHCMTQQQPV